MLPISSKIIIKKSTMKPEKIEEKKGMQHQLSTNINHLKMKYNMDINEYQKKFE